MTDCPPPQPAMSFALAGKYAVLPCRRHSRVRTARDMLHATDVEVDRRFRRRLPHLCEAATRTFSRFGAPL